MIELAATVPDHHPALLAWTLPPDQQAFTSLPGQLLPKLARQAERFPVTVLEDGRPIGFFLIAWGEHRDKYLAEPDPAALALTSLSIDPACQGRGAGLTAMQAVPGFVQKHFPTARRVVLAVNQRNHTALRLYARAGFVISHTREGPIGPQWVMELPLTPA